MMIAIQRVCSRTLPTVMVAMSELLRYAATLVVPADADDDPQAVDIAASGGDSEDAEWDEPSRG